MSKWRSESALLSRYAGSGAINTIAGFSAIFLLMRYGINPIAANIGGYTVGLFLSFVVSKKFVFRSNGRLASEGFRYLIAFFACFGANLAMLHFAINSLHVSGNFAQLFATLTYTALMYAATRWFVFRPTRS